ncbi:hypothetical protein [Flavobacterium sp.]|uniref:hypothetical protein n=1 Tax=Flavobacterium sp. TaxID=239 RepID=UPI004048AB36
MKIATSNPDSLIEDIISKIEDKTIKSWKYENDLFYHKGAQYIDHIYFSYQIIETKSIIEFTLHSDGNIFAESRGFQLLETMLTRHFENRIEIIK